MNAGIWIDHRKAIIVFVNNGNIDKKIIKSNIEKHLGRNNKSHFNASVKSKIIPADDIHERYFKCHLDVFFSEVSSEISDVQSILIYGPGEAKIEFKKHLEKNRLAGHIADIKTAEKMTDRQFEAKIKDYFINKKIN